MLFGPERVSLHTAKQFGVLNTVQQLSSFLWRVFLRPVGDAKARRRLLLRPSCGFAENILRCCLHVSLGFFGFDSANMRPQIWCCHA